MVDELRPHDDRLQLIHQRGMYVAVQRKSRRTRAGGDIAQVQSLLNALIKENRALKRSLDRLRTRGDESKRLPVRQIATLARKVERALAPGRAAPAPRKKSVQRRPASPETRQKRIEALARARAVRAANRQSAQR